MKKLAILLIALLPLAAQRRNESSWRYEDHETIHNSFRLSASSPAKLLVDNINGRIHVIGSSGSDVQVTVEKYVRAWSNETLAEGKRDTKVDMSQQGNFVRLYADGPFRDRNNRGEDYYGYRVIFDYEIQVPRQIELTLKNLNDPIDVEHTSGDFDVHGLNGSITLDDVNGSGSVNGLNGHIKATFNRNPEHDCEFHTLNGTIDAYFQPPLNADLTFQTLNGAVYSDFDVTMLPLSAGGTSRDGHFIYRASHRNMSVRAGSGGPKLSFHTLNGEILIHSKT